jgi:hypothetical protein
MRPETATLVRELLALPFLGRKVQGEILRCALQRLDELLVLVEQFRPGGMDLWESSTDNKKPRTYRTGPRYGSSPQPACRTAHRAHFPT